MYELTSMDMSDTLKYEIFFELSAKYMQLLKTVRLPAYIIEN